MRRLDYAAIRAQLSIREVLQLIDYEPTQRQGDQWRGPCPFCSDPSQPSSGCFSVNVSRNLFQCFRCQRRGNPLDLWTEASGLTLYAATLDLCQKLNIRYVAITNPQPPNTG